MLTFQMLRKEWPRVIRVSNAYASPAISGQCPRLTGDAIKQRACRLNHQQFLEARPSLLHFHPPSAPPHKSKAKRTIRTHVHGRSVKTHLSNAFLLWLTLTQLTPYAAYAYAAYALTQLTKGAIPFFPFFLPLWVLSALLFLDIIMNHAAHALTHAMQTQNERFQDGVMVTDGCRHPLVETSCPPFI